MQKLFLLILLFQCSLLFSQSQKDELFKKDIDSIMDELRFAFQYDQAMRNYVLYKTFDSGVIDSINRSENSAEYIIAHNFKTDKARRIWEEIIHPADKNSTQLMLQITQEYGYPGLDRIQKFYEGALPNEFNPTIILIHSPESLWPEIDRLIEIEFAAGRMLGCDYGYIKWHLSVEKTPHIWSALKLNTDKPQADGCIM